MSGLPRPNVPAGPVRALFDGLHELHHRAGWPSLRDMARDVGCSHTTVSVAFSEPRVPRWGLLELIVETLGGDTEEFHRLWLAASRAPEHRAPTIAAEAAAPQASPLPPRELPADVVAFTGRAEQVATLDALLAQAETAPAVVVSAVSGTAGVGKTALAVHWAHRVANRFPDGQLYVNLRGYDPDQPVHAADALEAFLRALGVAGPAVPHELSERAARYRTLVAGRRMLVLLDNAHSVDQVRDLLPGTPSCFVVVTSRDTLPALVARHGAVRVNLDLLAPAEAVALLRTLIGTRVDAEPEHAAVLADRCARLPLALRIAAELAAARPAATIAELADELGDESRRLDLLAAGGDEYTAVRAVFSWSLRYLTEDAAMAFTLLGLHPGVDIDRFATAALTGTDPAAARSLIDVLTRAHLLDELGGGRFGMHDLLRAYASEQAGRLGDPIRRAALTRLLDHYLSTATEALRFAFPTSYRPDGQDIGADTRAPRFSSAASAVAWLDAERANLLAIARAAVEGSEAHTIRLSAALAPYLDARAHYQDALTLHGLARTAARATNDRVGEGRASSLLGTVNRRLGDYRGALDSYEYALAIHREFGDRASEGATLHGLGLACWRLGRYGEALQRITEALKIYLEIGDRAREGSALYGLGLAYLQLGQHAEARVQHERALVVHREIGDRIGEGRALNNLGSIHQRLAHHAEARDHYQRSLVIAREVGNRAGEGVALGNLGDLDEELGRYDDARLHYEQALALCRQIGYRVGQAEALRGLGVVSGRLNRIDEALEHLRHAVALCHDLGERETEIRALLDLGDALHAAGRPDEALDRHRAALALAGETADSYALARALAAIAAVLRDTGETDGARQHWQQALAHYTDLGTPQTEEIRRQLATLDQDPELAPPTPTP